MVFALVTTFASRGIVVDKEQKVKGTVVILFLTHLLPPWSASHFYVNFYFGFPLHQRDYEF